MKISCFKLWVFGSMLAWLFFALIFDPMAGHALNVDDPYAGDAPCDPCAEIGEIGKHAGQDSEENMPWFPEGKYATTDQIITFWLEYPPPAGTAASVNPDSMPVALFGAVSNPIPFTTYGEKRNNSGGTGPTAKYLSMFRSSAHDSADNSAERLVRRAVWMIPAGALVFFVILSMASAVLVANDRYVFGDLRQNFLRSDNTLSWERVRIEAGRIVKLNAKVFAIILLYLAGSAFLFFMVQQCADPGPRVMEVIGMDLDRPVDRGEMSGEPAYDPANTGDSSDFYMLIVLYAGITGYLMVIKPSRHVYRRYKKGLHHRRRFYCSLDRRRMTDL
jgi:hypothetical protein